MDKEKTQKCSINMAVDDNGKLTLSHLSGNVGGILKCFAAATAYLIEAHELDTKETLEYFRTCIDTIEDK